MDALSYIWPLAPEVTNEHVNEASAATNEVIRAATSWANEVHLSLSGIRGNLSGIRENTSRYLFWTILVCIIITSVLLLHTLNSLWYQLSELNMHQSTYKDMWIEERSEMVQQLKHEEESRNAMFNMLIRQIREANKTQRQPPHHPTRQWIDSQQQQSRSPQQQREPLLSGSLERKMRAAIRNSNAMDDLSD
ncbi:hypothetical protein KJ359_005074 [Pestalotiopsis sp. 9143b]|nr:hypothetical protein KJ359_005074 [Pestalotiopsis sp. 9143b]